MSSYLHTLRSINASDTSLWSVSLLLETFIFCLLNLYDEVKFSTGWCRWTGWGLGGWWISEIGGSAAATWRCQCRRLRSSLWEKTVLHWWDNSHDTGSIKNHWLYPQTCPPCGRRPRRKRICRCLSCHRSPPDNKEVCVTDILGNKFTPCSAFNTICYLLPRTDVCIDIFEHRLQCGIISDTQILDLDLSMSGPTIWDLRHA